VLRLRRIVSADRTQALVTYKGPAMREIHKSREEIEFTVSDPEAFGTVLGRLGYQPGFRYEKYRTKFRAGGEPGLVTLDETPIGIFLELEGPEYWIDAAATRLGFSPADYITASYGLIYRRYQDVDPSLSPHMIFAAGLLKKPEIKQP
jgi:adenylate cyclase class 2